MTTDPTPLLSTVAASSATLVAIVGGLLVARFVTLDSEQQGAQHLLDDAELRQVLAVRRAEESTSALKNYEINQFVDRKVIEEIGLGTTNIEELRGISDYYTNLSDEELSAVVDQISSEFELARETLPELLVDQSADPEDWNTFKSHAELPEMIWEEAWEITYQDGRASENSEADVSVVGQSSYHSLFKPIISPSLKMMTPPEYVTMRIRRRDELRSGQDRARQHAEDISIEVARLGRARDAIVRPRGLRQGLTILIYFAIVGVISPIWILSRAPTNLTHTMGVVVFGLFLSGLASLLGYDNVGSASFRKEFGAL